MPTPFFQILVSNSCYVDDLLSSFKTDREYIAVSANISQESGQVGLNVKYVLTSKKNDPEILKKYARLDDPIENVIGLLWNLKTDVIKANINLNVFGRVNGKSVGPKLSETELSSLKTLRRTLARICHQLFDITG